VLQPGSAKPSVAQREHGIFLAADLAATLSNIMKRKSSIFLTLAIVAASITFHAHAGENVFRELGKDIRKAGKQAGKAGKEVGKDIGRAGKKIGKGVRDSTRELFRD